MWLAVDYGHVLSSETPLKDDLATVTGYQVADGHAGWPANRDENTRFYSTGYI